MVCEVCSVDYDNEGKPVVLSYPKFKAVQKPCPNCGCGDKLPAVKAVKVRSGGSVRLAAHVVTLGAL